MLAGRVNDPTGVVRGLHLRVGLVALSLIREAFVKKAQGGADEAGDRWQPLALATVARRRIGPADRRAAGLKASATRKGFLTAAQEKRWRGHFDRRLAEYRRAGVPEAEARGRAGRSAWAALRA